MSGAHHSESHARAADLLEREKEIAVLDGLTLDVAAGAGRFVVIEAAAGIGKSSLLAEARRRARRLRVLAARRGELEQEFCFGVVRQLFEAVLADPQERKSRSPARRPRRRRCSPPSATGPARRAASRRCTGSTGWSSTSPSATP
jgi:hypothetical protein